MTDYERGAYTPQTDAPLAFDPRRPSERRPLPMALIASAVVLVLLLAGVAMVYRGGVRHAGDSPRPVGEPVMAVKTAPTEPAPAASAPADMDVYAAGQSNTTANQTAAVAPQFAPPAEQPAARPPPSAATVAMLSKPSAPTHIERPSTPVEAAAKPEPTPVAHKSVEAKSAAAETSTAVQHPTAVAKGKPTLRKPDDSEVAAAGMTRTTASRITEQTADAAPTPVPTKKPVVAAITPATAVKPASALGASGRSVVQIGAFSSSALADQGYVDVSSAMPAQMGGKAKHVQPLDKDGATLYRTWLSGFATRADAVAFCEALKAKGKACIVKG